MKPYLEFERYGDNKSLYRSKADCAISGTITKIVMKGTYKGRHFMIGAYRLGFPVAYVEVINKDRYIINEHEDTRAESLHNVAGGERPNGSNYYGTAYWDQNDDRTYIGWEYNHEGDYSSLNPEIGGHKWTIAEILMEISQAIMEIEYEEYINKNFRYALA